MSRIIRRISRPETVTQALPDNIAVAMDARARSGKSDVLAYTGLTATNLGMCYMKFMEDQVMISRARAANPDMDLDMDGKIPSMLFTLWLENAFKSAPGALVDPMTCPVHDMLVDEFIHAEDEHVVTFKAVAYKLDLEPRKDQTNVEVVDLPMDEVDMLMGMIGTLEIRVDHGAFTYEVTGCFTEEKATAMLERVAKMPLPTMDDFTVDDDNDSDDS